jgi:hypothetical protein
MSVRLRCSGDSLREISWLKKKLKSQPSISKSKISTYTISSPNSTSGIQQDNKNTDLLYLHTSKAVMESYLSLINPDNPHSRMQSNNGMISAKSKHKMLSSYLLATKAIWKKKSTSPMLSNGQIKINSSISRPRLKPAKMLKMYLCP